MSRATIRPEGFKELAGKFSAFPKQYGAVLNKTLQDSLTVLDESKPPYPPAPPNSTYVRTGTLGRTLGSGQLPEGIRAVKPGGRMISAEWGTRLKYAPFVIGDKEQSRVHRGRWWTIQTVAKNAEPKIRALFEQAAQALANWLNR